MVLSLCDGIQGQRRHTLLSINHDDRSFIPFDDVAVLQVLINLTRISKDFAVRYSNLIHRYTSTASVGPEVLVNDLTCWSTHIEERFICSMSLPATY